MKKFLAFIFVCALAVAGLFYLIMWAPNTFEGDHLVIISKGENFAQVMEKLDKAGILRSKLLFKIAGKLHGSTKKIQIGKYRFRSGMSNLEILKDLELGTSIEAIMVVIPEGYASRRIASILAKNLGVDSSRLMQYIYDEDLVREFGINAQSAEGYLFPKTYRLYWQDDEEAIVRQLLQELHKEFDSTFEQRATQIGYSVHEVLTMASIVEGETRLDSERAIVAGVYYNRLKSHIQLQADPTIQFLLPGRPRALKYSDLALESPYNTYRYRGLPPGPVNNPGIASIKAALYPAKHKYLFFVANGEGGHTFTRNYKEHLKAVSQYRRIREEKKLQDKTS